MPKPYTRATIGKPSTYSLELEGARIDVVPDLHQRQVLEIRRVCQDGDTENTISYGFRDSRPGGFSDSSSGEPEFFDHWPERASPAMNLKEMRELRRIQSRMPKHLRRSLNECLGVLRENGGIK